jgi:hypothetical protein
VAVWLAKSFEGLCSIRTSFFSFPSLVGIDLSPTGGN